MRYNSDGDGKGDGGAGAGTVMGRPVGQTTRLVSAQRPGELQAPPPMGGGGGGGGGIDNDDDNGARADTWLYHCIHALLLPSSSSHGDVGCASALGGGFPLPDDTVIIIVLPPLLIVEYQNQPTSADFGTFIPIFIPPTPPIYPPHRVSVSVVKP